MSETEPLEITSAASPAADKKPEREGLPSAYRMRADAHYVDQLTTRRAERAHLDTPRADGSPKSEYHARPDSRPRSESGSRPDGGQRPDNPGFDSGPRIDTRRTDVGDREGAGEPRHRRGNRVLVQLSEDIATIQSVAAVLAGETSGVARRVSVDLIRSHAWRAGWLFRAHQILEGLHRAHVRPRPIGPMLAQLREALTPECRLTGSSLVVQTADWNATVDVDEDGLVAGIAGAVFATLGLAGDDDGLTISVIATVADGELRAVEVTQDTVQVGAVLGSRFLDASWGDRPGGWTAGLGATVARSVAHLAGGETLFLASDKRGSTIRFTFRSTRG